MRKAFSTIKTTYTNLHHITCLAHSLHRVSEALRESNQEANEFAANIKKILRKSNKNRSLYYSTNGLIMPPFPVITRWGTFINSCVILCDNFSKIKLFINSLVVKSLAANNLKKQLENNLVSKELFNVQKYKFLPDAIK